MPAVNRHEIEAVRKLERLGRRKAAELYAVLRVRMDPETGTAGPLSARQILARLGDTGWLTLTELFWDLERVHLIQPLPAPKGRWRCHLKQVDREVPA